MANRAAPALTLREGDQDELERWHRSTAARAGEVLRARIVLAAADGEANERIAQRMGTSKATVLKWRGRYQARGLGGLVDEPRSGRPRTVDHARIVSVTLAPPPKKYGVTHWSTRLLARHLGIGNKTVATAWREYGVQPWRSETFKFSTDPELVAKVTDVVGLYLDPPQNAVVLCVDEKSQIQALDRTAPMLPMQPGLPERRTHDYRRHGTTTLFAALEIATGKVTGARKPRHRHQEFLAFLKQIAHAYPEVELHLVMDNYAAHKRVEVRHWLAANPRIHVHFTPTSGSWLNLVEVWFGIIERQAIHRGSFGSVKDLNAKIRAFIDGWNDRCHPFVWTKTPEEILNKANRQPTSNTAH
ncbi:IS630 family transposase [Piscicoccus intestinalis]|uniref:IS630 family transposase n=1 Tax=Piscicoccus intestinalis TaxID=746033 RepID=UPI0009FDF922|nr:IS630 family transposase [Piscicoccus intestinalis]